MRSLIVALSLCFTATACAADAAEYPRAELLMEPDQLAETLSGDSLVILDARPREAYDKAHVPGALWIDAGEWKQAFEGGPDAEAWSQRIGRLGIEADDAVVVYDDNSSKDAARVWWILRFWGVDDARLLNGGWSGWRAAEKPTETQAPPAPQAAEFQAMPTGRRLATTESVLDSLDRDALQIIDARSESEFCGLDPRGNRRAGAIPGAKNLEWSDLIDSETQRFKSAAELSKLFEEAGIDLQEPLASHCQSGGRASVMTFATELMGAEQAQNYYAGWSEWGNTEDTPVIKPEPRDR